MRRPVSILVLCLAAALSGGCGGGEAQTVAGDGYTFELPAGWEDITGDEEKTTKLLGELSATIAGDYDAAVVSDQVSAGLRTNFSVRVYDDVPAGYDSKRLVEQNVAVFENPDQVDGLLGDLFEIDYPGREPQRIELGGQAAYEIRYGLTSPRAEMEVLQVYAVHEGSAYVATLRAGPEVFDPDAPDVRRILETWTWD